MGADDRRLAKQLDDLGIFINRLRFRVYLLAFAIGCTSSMITLFSVYLVLE